MGLLTCQSILFLVLVNTVLARHHDDGKRTPESYDDSWMNDINVRKHKPKDEIEDGTESGSELPESIQVGYRLHAEKEGPEEQYTLKVVCDDITTVFVDGEQKTVAGTGVWNQMATLQIPTSTRTVGIKCHNSGGAYGIIAVVADSSGEVISVSDNSWKCSNQAQDGWSKGEFTEDASWRPAAYYTSHGAYNGNDGAWREISPNKRVIWTNSNADATVYCRKELVSDRCILETDEDGSKYRGNISVTVSGHSCQRWDSQSPNGHSRTQHNYPNAGLEENYCRNPDGEVGAWCYNGEGTYPRWDLCDIPGCGANFADDKIDALRKEIMKKIRKQKLDQLKSYLKSDQSLAVFQWQLLTNLKERGLPIDLEDEAIRWIMNDRESLETILTSGDVEDNKWKEAIDIIAEIIRQDADAKEGLKLKLAIAIGLTFSTEVFSMAHGGAIDGITRYHNFARWADEKLLFEPFYNLNAWQMRYVVGSWAEDDEMIWARNNVLEDFKNPDKIGSVTHSMVEYKLYNDDGISVHDSGYYYGKPVTLEWVHTIGGVCGAISKFGSGMAQAFGIPGLPVGQPGHCAFIWLKNGTKWYLDNDISGWAESTTHSGIQYTWKIQAPFFPMMNEAQLNPDAYRLSEKMRIIAESFSDSKHKFAILEEAITVCPQNYELWYDMSDVFSQESESKVDQKILENSLSPILLQFEENSRKIKNIAKGKKVTASEYPEDAHRIADGGSEWVSNNTNSAWVEIDLAGPCSIHELRIHWWGISYSNEYDLLAEVDGKFVLIRTKEDEDREGSYYNPWGVLQGWDAMTSKVRLEMRDGNKDPWYGKYYFGIRQIVITGIEHGNKEDISVNMHVETKQGNTGQELVDGNINTYWTSNDKSSWIKIDLEGLCVIDEVRFNWLNDDIQGRQKIQYLVGGKSKKQKKGQFGIVNLAGIAGDLYIRLHKSSSYSIGEITAVGSCYSAREILKIKALKGFIEPDTSYNAYVIDDISEIIENFECDLCF